MAGTQPRIRMPEMTEKEAKNIKKTFKKFDKNGDGTISTDELQSALALMGFVLTAKQVHQMLDSVAIDLEEFHVLIQTSKYLKSMSTFSVKQIQQIRIIFDSYDTSGDGTLSAEEITHAMRMLGQKPTEVQMREFLVAADVDNSGSVDFPEFLDIMSKSEMLKKATMHKTRRHGGLVGWFVKNNVQPAGISGASEEYLSCSEDSSSSEESDDEEGACTSNIKVLAITAFLFALITALQLAGALFVGSQVLLADCISMGVDACTYLANIFVECQKGARCYKPSELIIGSVSLAILMYLTWDVMCKAYCALQHLGGEDEEESPWMPWMVLFFALLGLTFDAFSLYYFHKDKHESGHSANMFTALLHVGADFVRSSTTLVSSLLIFAGIDIEKVDSIAAILLGVFILAGAVYGVWELLVETRNCYCGSVHQEQAGVHAIDNEDSPLGAAPQHPHNVAV